MAIVCPLWSNVLPDTKPKFQATPSKNMLTSKTEVVARYDFSSVDRGTETLDGSFAMLGVATSIRDNVQFIPNVLVDTDPGADDSRVTGRVTLHVDF